MTFQEFQAQSYDFQTWTDAQNFIGGRFQQPVESKGELEISNPRYGKTISKVLLSGYADVDAAVKAAKINLTAWQEKPLRERAYIFYKLRELMHRDAKTLAWLVSHENGKTYVEGMAEVEKAIECIEYGCSLPNLAAGDQLDVSRGVNCQLEYAGLGIVAGVTPFNFPLMVPFWMIPQAIVGGNAFILKPSEQTPLSSVYIAKLLQEAGLPDGIFSLVQGAKDAVEALCDHPEIKAFGFVGSTRVAKMVYARATSTGKRALCLGGAKNHLIVVPDADIQVAADNIVASFTGCAGQRCMAAANLLAVGDVEHIINAIKAKALEIKLGQDMGAINSQLSVNRIEGYIASAVTAGAKVTVDGRGKSAQEGGYWVGPTIIEGVTAEMTIAKEEIFGPVLSIIRVKDLSEAIAIENSNPYGNAAAVYTTSGDVARLVMNKVEAGMCGVNVGVPVPREPFGFGGWNDSLFGQGNITGWDGFRFWTRMRKITTKWALQKDQTWMS
jgi:malonate-semialdehyde dehydrogenase (acetylating)/methylmalonate-semialdehyde dehydrogenase